MSHTSTFKVKVAADCSNQHKVGATLATGWIFFFFSSALQFKELYFVSYPVLQWDSGILYDTHNFEKFFFGFCVTLGAAFTSSKTASLICCAGMGKSFVSG